MFDEVTTSPTTYIIIEDNSQVRQSGGSFCSNHMGASGPPFYYKTVIELTIYYYDRN